MAQTEFNAAKFKQHVKEVLREVAEDVAFDIEMAYEKSIDEFYNDYSPRKYKRTYSTYLASTGYNNKNMVVQNGEYSFIAGIDVSPFNIPGSPYREHITSSGIAVTKDFIFSNTFDKGLHGFQSGEYKKKFADEHDWADGKKWKNRSTRIVNSVSRSNPPEEAMRRRFKEIVRSIEPRMRSITF